MPLCEDCGVWSAAPGTDLPPHPWDRNCGREGQFGTRTITITAMEENRLQTPSATVSRVSDLADGVWSTFRLLDRNRRFKCRPG